LPGVKLFQICHRFRISGMQGCRRHVRMSYLCQVEMSS
jgi:hypothetical protein